MNQQIDDNPASSSQLEWRRGTKCSNETCAEVAISGNNAYLRNSKDPAGQWLVFNADEWRSFLAGAQDHEFDIG
jgi:hypothetical protein